MESRLCRHTPCLGRELSTHSYEGLARRRLAREIPTTLIYTFYFSKSPWLRKLTNPPRRFLAVSSPRSLSMARVCNFADVANCRAPITNSKHSSVSGARARKQQCRQMNEKARWRRLLRSVIPPAVVALSPPLPHLEILGTTEYTGVSTRNSNRRRVPAADPLRVAVSVYAHHCSLMNHSWCAVYQCRARTCAPRRSGELLKCMLSNFRDPQLIGSWRRQRSSRWRNALLKEGDPQRCSRMLESVAISRAYLKASDHLHYLHPDSDAGLLAEYFEVLPTRC